MDAFLASGNNWCLAYFTLEMLIKIFALGPTMYWYDKWNRFDASIVVISIIALHPKTPDLNVTVLRLLRLVRVFRAIKSFSGLYSQFQTLYDSLVNAMNTFMLLILLLFTWAVAGMSLFGNMDLSDNINKDANFTTFYLSMMTLFRASTGESWNDLYHDCYAQTGFPASVFWISFVLAIQFVIINIFKSVIVDSYIKNNTPEEQVSKYLRKKHLAEFQGTWAKYNPCGELYMRTLRLEDFLRELPVPLGF